MANKISRPMVLVISAPLAFALGSGAARSQDTVGDLSRLHSSKLLKQAQIDNAKLDADLAKYGNKTVAEGLAGDAPTDTGNTRLPVVKGVFGRDDKLYATFLFADGSTLNVKKGGRLPGGFTVVSLNAEQVVVRDARGKTLTLGFSEAAPVEPQSPQGVLGTSYPSPIPSMPMPVVRPSS